MTTIATICARGKSTGLPGKNIRPLLGKPLIVYSIEQALACPDIDEVYVSTDDPAIAEIARRAGGEVPFLRPSHLVTVDAPKIPVIQHMVGFLEEAGVSVDRIVDLDPTSPLRTITDISRCIAMLDDECDLVITGYEAEKNPYFNMVELAEGGLASLCKSVGRDIAGRQQAPKVYAMNASIYVWHRNSLESGLWDGRVRLYVMPRERSVDIDSSFDFQLVELLMRQQQKTIENE